MVSLSLRYYQRRSDLFPELGKKAKSVHPSLEVSAGATHPGYNHAVSGSHTFALNTIVAARRNSEHD